MDQTLFRFGRSLALALVTLFLMITLMFFLLRLAPQSPLANRLVVSAELYETLVRHYGLDRPPVEQYLEFLKRLVLHFDLGPSFGQTDRSVSELLARALPRSATIAGIALMLVLAGGFLIGAAGALAQGTVLDLVALGFTVLARVVPSFVVAPLLMLVFMRWLPPVPSGGGEGGAMSSLVLPVLTVVLAQTPDIVRLVRLSMIEVLGSTFVRAARAKGMPPVRLFVQHVLRPAFLPVIAYLGALSMSLCGSVVLVDMYFATGGVGNIFIDAIHAGDTALVLGVTLLGGVTVLAANTLSEFAVTLLDPRVRR